ncbi:hypothetical protein GGR56DRAFT_255096 [Xylariaceae sp. FL0804]|nr:hypothetical protein GGR56DRAFT_255096 [Xylariaceae sp. FL0804]
MVSTAFPPFHHSPSHPFSHSSPTSPKKKAMSITQTYFLAHKARAKLSSEAARPDHNLRLLVGHANLLDSLMIDLAEAEREQESWFNQSVRGAGAAATKTEQKHIRWADTVPEEEDWEADLSDSDSSDDDEEDVEMTDAAPLRRMPANNSMVPATPQFHAMDEDDDFEDDDEEDYAALSLTRTPSHAASPPELVEHDSESSEDESMPPSPPSTTLPTTFVEKQEAESTVTRYYDSRQDDEEDKSDFYSQGFYLPPRNPGRLVSAISVY